MNLDILTPLRCTVGNREETQLGIAYLLPTTGMQYWLGKYSDIGTHYIIWGDNLDGGNLGGPQRDF